SEGYLHRDVKSSNIMLVSKEGTVKAVITDLGLARTFAHSTIASPSVQGAGRSGTPEYMAPEQVRGGKLLPAADIYSLGVVMYEMITGVLPFRGTNRQQVGMRRLDESPRPPRDYVPDLDSRWELVILRCLEQEPEKRFKDVMELAKALQAIDEGDAEANTPGGAVGMVRRNQRTSILLKWFGMSA